MTPTPSERRRAEDVLKTLEGDVLPRIRTLEGSVSSLQMNGCAHRIGDLRRVDELEDGVTRIFEKVDSFGTILTDHRIDMEKKIGGIRTWVLGGCVVVLLALLSFFAIDYANSISRTNGNTLSSITAK